ncbi:hypothetical protein ACOSQ4_021468 [Xanthoceras sorbifolium]
MANNGKEEASRSVVNSPTNMPTSNQARFATLEAERKENNNGREIHVNENPGRFRRGGRVERGLLRWDNEEHPRLGRRPHNRLGERNYQLGRRRPKVDFSRFSRGDPHEWLDKGDHYFRVYEVAREIGLPSHAYT